MPSKHAPSFPATPSLVSLNTTACTSSIAPLKPIPSSSSQPAQKDYSKSFGLLQSQYGWGPATYAPTPILSNNKEPKKKRTGRDTRSTGVPEEKMGERQSGGKDYESVFGSLSSRYGFGGSWPMPTKKSKDFRSERVSVVT
ncbi:hypothetical protein BD310DRAFT_934332 [Dichomitus squalens]|uniref:Uncharacterized protein n=1 Tax=Dichomitus squalens TaxID=114155 RepID=A0A4Q9PLR8_9APHY|nr:hypothetical protein BD310DRAFT_934332 [Dichomitus squalens]